MKTQVIRSSFLFGAADLSQKDNTLSFVVGEKQFQTIDKADAVHGIAANADRGRLAEAEGRGLRHHLAGERGGAGDDTDRPALFRAGGHDAQLAAPGRQHALRIRPHKAGGGAFERAAHAHHVEHGDALRDADDKRQFRLYRLQNGGGGIGRRHEDKACRGPGRVHCIAHRIEDRQVQVTPPAFARTYAGDHLGAVSHGALDMIGRGAAGQPLAENLGAGIDQNRHYAASERTSATTRLTASAISLART